MKLVCTVKLTGTLFGSWDVCGLSKGPKAPLRPVVKGVLAVLQELKSSVHCRRTPVWLKPNRVPSTETTCPSVRLSLGVTLIWGSKACGFDVSSGSVGSNVLAKAVPTSATESAMTTAAASRGTRCLAMSLFMSLPSTLENLGYARPHHSTTAGVKASACRRRGQGMSRC